MRIPESCDIKIINREILNKKLENAFIIEIEEYLIEETLQEIFINNPNIIYHDISYYNNKLYITSNKKINYETKENKFDYYNAQFREYIDHIEEIFSKPKKPNSIDVDTAINKMIKYKAEYDNKVYKWKVLYEMDLEFDYKNNVLIYNLEDNVYKINFKNRKPVIFEANLDYKYKYAQTHIMNNRKKLYKAYIDFKKDEKYGDILDFLSKDFIIGLGNNFALQNDINDSTLSIKYYINKNNLKDTFYIKYLYTTFPPMFRRNSKIAGFNLLEDYFVKNKFNIGKNIDIPISYLPQSIQKEMQEKRLNQIGNSNIATLENLKVHPNISDLEYKLEKIKLDNIFNNQDVINKINSLIIEFENKVKKTDNKLFNNHLDLDLEYKILLSNIDDVYTKYIGRNKEKIGFIKKLEENKNILQDNIINDSEYGKINKILEYINYDKLVFYELIDSTINSLKTDLSYNTIRRNYSIKMHAILLEIQKELYNKIYVDRLNEQINNFNKQYDKYSNTIINEIIKYDNNDSLNKLIKQYDNQDINAKDFINKLNKLFIKLYSGHIDEVIKQKEEERINKYKNLPKI